MGIEGCLEPQKAELLPSKERLSVGDITVVMPIGGAATRARLITNDKIPKHLIELGNGETVLDTICGQLQAVGFRRFVFCVGHHKDQITGHLARRAWIKERGVAYEISAEDTPLGPDGAILQAIRNLGLQGQGMTLPGDVMLPWQELVRMNLYHKLYGVDVTLAVTNRVTERTPDIGKIVVENMTNRLLWCYGRDTADIPLLEGAANLTSAASSTISFERYCELCEAYARANPDSCGPLSMRDEILPWAVQNGGFQIHAYNLRGEMLDLGTPSSIQYGQQNWNLYV